MAALWLPPFVEVGETVLLTVRAAESQVVVPCFFNLKVEEVIVEACMSWLK